MNAEIKQRWVAALRSGEYKQGTGILHRDDKYCCLGVLCDLHAKETDGEWTTYDDWTYSYLNSVGLLPRTVCAWSGIDYELPNENELIALNDTKGKDFNEIADFIEEKL